MAKNLERRKAMDLKKQQKRFRAEDIFTVLFFLCFLLQFAFLSYDCLFKMESHLGYDASASLLKASEMTKQNTLFIRNYLETTSLQFDTPVPLAAFLHLFIKDLFLSYGIALWICDIAFFVLFFYVMKSLKFSRLASVITLNLVSLSYLDVMFNNANDLGYYSCMFVNFGVCIVKMCILLMVIKVVIDLKDKEKLSRSQIVFAAATEIMLFITALSSGFYLAVTVLLPLLVLLVVAICVKNEISILKKPSAVFLYIAVAVTVLGKLLQKYAVGFESRDSFMEMIPLEDFGKNLSSIFLGFLQLTGALPASEAGSVQVFSRNGIDHILALVIVTVLLISFVLLCRKALKNFSDAVPHAFLAIIAGLNILMFAFLKMTYSAKIFECRYLIPVLIVMILSSGIFIDSLSSRALFKYIGMMVLLICVLGSHILDHRLYSNRTIDTKAYDAVMKIVEEQSPDVVYGFGGDISLDLRNFRVVDTGHIYKTLAGWNPVDIFHEGGDYLYYDSLSDAPQKNMLIVSRSSIVRVPETLLSEYTFVTSSGPYLIYMSDTNRIEQGGYV